MTLATSADVHALLEKAHPTTDDVFALRDAICSDTQARRVATDLISSLPEHRAESDADAKTALRKGIALWAIGREAESLEWLEASRSKISNALRARTLGDAGRPHAAIEALSDTASDAFEMTALGDAHADLGNFERVNELSEQAEEEGHAALASYLAGRSKELEGEREQAAAHYRDAVEDDPDHGWALFRLARFEYTYGDEEDTVDLYRRCLETSCPPMNAYLNLGNVYEDRGEFSKARDSYRSVLRIHPGHARARLFLADAQASLDMFYDEDLERRADKRSQVLRLPVTDFELSVRSRNCLAKMGVRTLGDLIQRTEAELLSYKNFGETSLQEIKDILAQKGLRLGMARDEVGREDHARSILEGIGAADHNAALERPLGELELSVRSRHCMNVLGLKTVGDLAARSEPELMTIKNFGQTSLNEVKQKLAELGLTLATGK